MASLTSTLRESGVTRARSAPQESSVSEGTFRGRAFKRKSDGKNGEIIEEKIEKFYSDLQKAVQQLPPAKRARTDGVLLGPRPSPKSISPLDLNQVDETRKSSDKSEILWASLFELKLN